VYYGRKSNNNETTLTKVQNTIITLTIFLKHLIIFNPNIVHINTAFDKNSILRDIPFIVISSFARKKIFIKIHGSSYDLLLHANAFLKILSRIFIHFSDVIGVLSNEEKKEFITTFNTSKIVTVKNIVKVSQIHVNSTPSSLNTKAKYFCCSVSRMIKQKGIEDIILALPSIKQRIPNVKVLIIGDGPETETLKKLSSSLELDSNIVWAGYISNNEVCNYIQCSAMFIFTSHLPEGMPMVLTEAMKTKIPIITTKNRFAVDYFKNKHNCLFYNKGDYIELSKKAIELYYDRELRNCIVKNNISLLSDFSEESVGLEFSKIYSTMQITPKNKNNNSLQDF